MIPFVAVISVPHHQSRTLRLWVPLFLLWILLLPIVIVLSPFIFIACLVCRVNPFQACAISWQILSALRETNVEVAHRTASISVCIL